MQGRVGTDMKEVNECALEMNPFQEKLSSLCSSIKSEESTIPFHMQCMDKQIWTLILCIGANHVWCSITKRSYQNRICFQVIGYKRLLLSFGSAYPVDSSFPTEVYLLKNNLLEENIEMNTKKIYGKYQGLHFNIFTVYK